MSSSQFSDAQRNADAPMHPDIERQWAAWGARASWMYRQAKIIEARSCRVRLDFGPPKDIPKRRRTKGRRMVGGRAAPNAWLMHQQGEIDNA